MTTKILAGAALALGLLAYGAPAKADGQSVAICYANTYGGLHTNGKVVDGGKAVECGFNLVKGQDYIVQAEHDDDFFGHADLVDPQGKVIVPGFITGVEVRAAFSAGYRFRLSEIESIQAEILTDCKADARTQCVLKPGKPVPGADDAFDDEDAYKVSLTKGKSYTLTMDGGGSNVQATLLDKNGKMLAVANGGANHPAVIKYKAKASGDFYLRTAGGYRYTVSVK